MKCPDCDKDMMYLNPLDGKDEYYCKHCKQTVLCTPDPDREMEEIEVDGDIYDSNYGE